MTKPAYDFSQMDFSRVCVIGSAGSGKTTFCKALGNLLGRQVTHLDKILWGENWTELTREQQVQILTSVVETDQWIIDGLWASTLEMRYKRATKGVPQHAFCLRASLQIIHPGCSKDTAYAGASGGSGILRPAQDKAEPAAHVLCQPLPRSGSSGPFP